jgi:carbon monoxide dehydrogenase subunit G
VKFEGRAQLPGTRPQVWQLLTDPARLEGLLPGAEKLEAAGPDRYKVAVKFGIAAITGKYAGAVEITEKDEPSSLRMKIEGKGAPGFMRGEGRLELHEKSGGTEVRYAGDAQVGGVIASVGQRMIEAAAKKIIQQFFDSAAAALRAGT